MPAAALGHTLDHKLPMVRDVHLHAARHTQAAGTLWRLVNMRERTLQLRVVCVKYAAFDRETLNVHGRQAPDQPCCATRPQSASEYSAKCGGISTSGEPGASDQLIYQNRNGRFVPGKQFPHGAAFADAQQEPDLALIGAAFIQPGYHRAPY